MDAQTQIIVQVAEAQTQDHIEMVDHEAQVMMVTKKSNARIQCSAVLRDNETQMEEYEGPAPAKSKILIVSSSTTACQTEVKVISSCVQTDLIPELAVKNRDRLNLKSNFRDKELQARFNRRKFNNTILAPSVSLNKITSAEDFDGAPIVEESDDLYDEIAK